MMGRAVIILGLAFGSAALPQGAPGFGHLDANQDGGISKSEAAMVKGLDFAKADTNQDGRLSPAEYKARCSALNLI